MENYTGYLEYTDAQIGRVIDAVAASGELDNTLIIYIVGDNGASAEGGLEGTVNEIASLNGIQLGLAGPARRSSTRSAGRRPSRTSRSAGRWAVNTPFQWTKQVASHFGGTRNPMVICWPKRITDKGGLRSQFHHVIDIAPTILEAAGIPEPQVVNGVAQKPIEGVSMRYTFDPRRADERRTTQYFEMLGNRAIYNDGWMAATRHGISVGRPPARRPASTPTCGSSTTSTKDFSQANELAAQNPEKLKELQAAFDVEARKYNVLPLDDRFAAALRPVDCGRIR